MAMHTVFYLTLPKIKECKEPGSNAIPIALELDNVPLYYMNINEK